MLLSIFAGDGKLLVVLSKIGSARDENLLFSIHITTISLFLIFAFFSLPASTNAIIRFVPQGYNWSFISFAKLRLKFSLLGSITFMIFALNAYFSTSAINPFISIVIALFFPVSHSFDLFEYFLLVSPPLKRVPMPKISTTATSIKSTIDKIFTIIPENI